MPVYSALLTSLIFCVTGFAISSSLSKKLGEPYSPGPGSQDREVKPSAAPAVADPYVEGLDLLLFGIGIEAVHEQRPLQADKGALDRRQD